MSPDSLFFEKKWFFASFSEDRKEMAPTSTTTKTQTQLGFDPSTSHMVSEHSTIWAIASLDTFTVVECLWPKYVNIKYPLLHTHIYSKYMYVHTTLSTHVCHFATVLSTGYIFGKHRSYINTTSIWQMAGDVCLHLHLNWVRKKRNLEVQWKP